MNYLLDGSCGRVPDSAESRAIESEASTGGKETTGRI